MQAEDLPLLSPCRVQRLGCLGWPRPASICLPSCIWQNIGAWKHVAIGNHMRDFWQQEACDIFDVCFAWGCSSYIHGVLWSKLWSPMLQVLRIMQGLFTWQSVSGSVVACSSCWWIFKESIWFADAWGCRQGVCSWLCQLCSKQRIAAQPLAPVSPNAGWQTCRRRRMRMNAYDMFNRPCHDLIWSSYQVHRWPAEGSKPV